MSLLHRNLVAAAFQELMRKIEPAVADTAEAVLAVVAPKVAPLATAVIETAAAIYGATTSDHVAAGVAAAGAPPAAPTPAAAPAAPAPVPVAAPVNLAAGPNQAALAAVDALGLQLSQLATQLAAIRSNLVPPQS
jgi:hypothetical protein